MDVLKDMGRNIGLMDEATKDTGKRIKCKARGSYSHSLEICILEGLKEASLMARALEDGQMEIYTKEDTEWDIRTELAHLFQFNKGGSIWGSG